MDPRYHVAAFREVCLLVSGTQLGHGVGPCAAACRGEMIVQRPKRRPARRICGVRISDRGRSSRGRCDQSSAHRGADNRRAHPAAENRAAQSRIRLRKQRDKSNRTNQFDCNRTVITGSGGVDSEGDEIKPIMTDLGRRHIDEVVAVTMRALRRQEVEYAKIHLMCASLRQKSFKDRNSEGAAMVKHPLSDCNRARDHASGSLKHTKAKTPSLDSSCYAQSSAGDVSSSNSISSACERRVGNNFRAPKLARDRDRNSD